MLKPNNLKSKLFGLLIFYLTICLPAHGSTFSELTAAGDRAYSQRKPENSQQIDLAIAHYTQALNLEPENFSAHFKLIEALYFKGYFVSNNSSDKKEIFSKLLKLSEECIDILSKSTKTDLRELKPSKQAKLLNHNSDAAQTYFWNSISWGLWGMTYGNLASARKSVATKVRDAATVLMKIDPNFASAGGYRLLGRLHTLAPKIPFFTFWIDREYGIKLLRKANRISTEDPRNELFLAEALLEYKSEKKLEALELLNNVSRRTPDVNYYTEQLETIAEAKKKLKEIKAND